MELTPDVKDKMLKVIKAVPEELKGLEYARIWHSPEPP
jgi:hypothetical protein